MTTRKSISLAAPTIRKVLSFAAPTLAVGILLVSQAQGRTQFPRVNPAIRSTENTVSLLINRQFRDLGLANSIITKENATQRTIATLERQLATHPSSQFLQNAINRNIAIFNGLKAQEHAVDVRLVQDSSIFPTVIQQDLTALRNLGPRNVSISMFIRLAQQNEARILAQLQAFLTRHPATPSTPL